MTPPRRGLPARRLGARGPGNPFPEPVGAGGPGLAGSRVHRLTAMLGVAALHLGVYFGVNAVNGARPAADLHDFTLPVDVWIPYLGWSSYVYYVGDLYIVLWAGYIVWRLPGRAFGRAMKAYTGMILAGGAIQVLLPAHGPYPDDFHWLQAAVRDALREQPYACLPSMHVALTLLPAAFGRHVLGSRATRLLSGSVALLVAASTATAKEHYVLDVLAGAALAAGFYGYWRRGLGTREAGAVRFPRGGREVDSEGRRVRA